MKRIDDGFYRLPEILELFGRTKSSVYRWIAAGRFPPPVRAVGGVKWRKEEVEAAYLGKYKAPKKSPEPA